MKNLTNFIAGLQIIENVEPGIDTFNSQNDIFYIGCVDLYDEEAIEELELLGFNINTEYECFEYYL